MPPEKPVCTSRSSLVLLAFCHRSGVICISEVTDIFLANLIPACALSSPAFLIMYSAYTKKAMAPRSSTLAWKIPSMEEPGGLQSMGLLRVGHDSETSLSLFTFMHWRGKWQLTPVFLPGESQGWRSLVGCCLRGRTELDTTDTT